jgi:septum formation protein
VPRSESTPAVSLYLASASPRRQSLLCQIGVRFEILTVLVDETVLAEEAPPDYVTRLSAAKASAGWQQLGDDAAGVVLAADTTVVCNGIIFGKPRNRDEGVSMLMDLGGRSHQVLTSVSLQSGVGMRTRISSSEVWFREISRPEAQRYWETGEPCDKAGGYAIQGLGAVFVQQLIGSYSGVMGLPLYETAELLDAAQVPRWQGGV